MNGPLANFSKTWEEGKGGMSEGSLDQEGISFSLERW